MIDLFSHLQILLIFPGDGAPTFEEYVKRSCSPKPSISCGDHEPSDDEDDDITNLHNEESEDLQTIASNINTCETQQALTCSGVKRRINAEESEPPKKRKNRQLWQADNIEEVIFIDSTWYQVHKIKRDERLKGDNIMLLYFCIYLSIRCDILTLTKLTYFLYKDQRRYSVFNTDKK